MPTSNGDLASLRLKYPRLQVTLKPETSFQLAASTVSHELDFVISTSPAFEISGPSITEITTKSLYVVGPATLNKVKFDIELLQSDPNGTYYKAVIPIGRTVAQAGIFCGNKAIFMRFPFARE